MIGNAEKVKRIHEASMCILRDVGIKFHSQKAIDVLRQNDVKTDGEVAFFEEDQIMKWIEKAPKIAKLYARNPVHNMEIGGDNVYPAPCYGASAVMDPDGTSRPGLMKDYVELAKLFHVNPDFKINGGILVQPEDIPTENFQMVMHYAALLTSDKCLLVPSGNQQTMENVINMTGALFEGVDKLPEKPHILTIVNTNSPLQYDDVMLETLITFAKHGQPFVVTAAAMAGTTGPVTMAGTMAMVNAEILAGIALTQMIRPGTPVIYASITSNADLRNGFMAIGSPEGAMAYETCTLMAKHYGLPCRGGGAVTDALTLNAQSGYESMLNYLVCSQNKMNLIIHSAGIMEGYSAVSYEKVICDFEIIGMVKRFLEGLDFSGEAIPLDLIKKVGQGGEYVTSDHTLQHCRSAFYEPKLSIRGRTQGHDQFNSNINRKLQDMLSNYKAPDLDAGKLKTLESQLISNGVEQGIIDKIKEYY